MVLIPDGRMWRIEDHATDSDVMDWIERVDPDLLDRRFERRRDAFEYLQALMEIEPLHTVESVPASALKPVGEGEYAVVLGTRSYRIRKVYGSWWIRGHDWDAEIRCVSLWQVRALLGAEVERAS